MTLQVIEDGVIIASTGLPEHNATKHVGSAARAANSGVAGLDSSGDILHPTGRCATFVVAANDSSALSKQQADYVCDGTADDVQIQAALDAIASHGNGKLVQLEGTYIWAAAVTYSASNLEWVGIGTVINDCSAIAGTGGALKIEGVITGTNSALTGDAAKGQTDVTVADASSFSAGDWIRIRSEALFNSGTQHYGEIQKIASIAGNVITCEDMLSFDCDVADTGTVDLLTVYENIQLKNMHFIGNYGESSWRGILFKELYNVLIEDIHWTDSQCYPILVYDIVGFEVRGCSIKDSDQAGLGYGVNISNASRDIRIHHNKFYNCRHGIVCSGDNSYGIQTNQIYDANTFRYSTKVAGAIGPHNTYDGLVISNNSVMNDGLLYIPGLHTTVIGNNIYNDKCVNGGILHHYNGKHTVILGNVIKCTGSYNNIIVQGESVVITGNYMEGDSIACIYSDVDCNNVNICNNVINYSGVSGAIYFKTNGASAAIQDFLISGNDIISSASVGILLKPYAHNVENVTINNNNITASCSAIQIYEGTTAKTKHIVINGNSLNCGTHGILIYETEDFGIANNAIRDSTTVGISIRNYGVGCSKYKISDNYITNCTIDIQDEMQTGVVYNKYSDLFMDVLAVSTTHIRSNEDLSAATPITFTLDAQPDIPRTLSWAFDTHAQVTEYDMEVIGIDAKGNSVTETWDEGDGWSGETSNAFATITSIKMTSRTGTGVADTMDIGITDVLGLSNIIYETSDVFKIKKNNANATVATAQVNTTYDTYDMSVITLGAGDDFTIWYKSNLNIIS